MASRDRGGVGTIPAAQAGTMGILPVFGGDAKTGAPRRFHKSEKASTAERYWSKVSVRTGEECWNWLGDRNRSGHGHLADGGKMRAAHRTGWRLMFGPIPEGMCVCHICDNPACQNPMHWFLGTNADNVADRQAKGRHHSGHVRGEDMPQAKLTEVQVREIRRRVALGERQADLAKCFGVSRPTINHVVKRRVWSHVKQE